MCFPPVLLLLLFNVAALALLQASWVHALAPAPNKHLAAGQYYFNYIQDNGQVFSWGHFKGLGAGDVPDSAFPVQMLGVIAASDVSAITMHTCVVDGGAAKCTGYGYYGQLGNGTKADSYLVVQVQGLTAGVQQVVVGRYHSCAVLNTGGMRCWGSNEYGQLGDGKNVNTNVSVPVTNYADSGVHSACAGVEHTCIVTTSGAALCTGRGDMGQLGNGGTVKKNVMTQVTGLTDGKVTQISCGYLHTCAMTSTGGLACFGRNYFGALGFDFGSDQVTPVYPVGLQAGIITVVAGESSTCVIDNPARTARCFGCQYAGMFANPNATDTQNYSPVAFAGGVTGIVEIAVGMHTICMPDEFGGVQCAGLNNYLQLGTGSNQPNQRGTLDFVVGFPVTSAPSSRAPTLLPTLAPTLLPTLLPTLAPTSSPTLAPTLSPTSSPTLAPTLAPTLSPSTLAPTSSPAHPCLENALEAFSEGGKWESSSSNDTLQYPTQLSCASPNASFSALAQYFTFVPPETNEYYLRVRYSGAEELVVEVRLQVCDGLRLGCGARLLDYSTNLVARSGLTSLQLTASERYVILVARKDGSWPISSHVVEVGLTASSSGNGSANSAYLAALSSSLFLPIILPGCLFAPALLLALALCKRDGRFNPNQQGVAAYYGSCSASLVTLRVLAIALWLLSVSVLVTTWAVPYAALAYLPSLITLVLGMRIHSVAANALNFIQTDLARQANRLNRVLLVCGIVLALNAIPAAANVAQLLSPANMDVCDARFSGANRDLCTSLHLILPIYGIIATVSMMVSAFVAFALGNVLQRVVATLNAMAMLDVKAMHDWQEEEQQRRYEEQRRQSGRSSKRVSGYFRA